jgi:hypothetical protein
LKYLIVLLFIIPLVSNAQTINGFIYDHETTVKGVKLLNTTQNILAYSDDKGQFKIKARLKDTLIINSYFHSQQTIIISQNYFKKEIIIELQKIANALDESKVTKILEKKIKTPEIVYVQTQDLITLFKNNRLFNQSLLISELKIKAELQYLFFFNIVVFKT